MWSYTLPEWISGLKPLFSLILHVFGLVIEFNNYWQLHVLDEYRHIYHSTLNNQSSLKDWNFTKKKVWKPCVSRNVMWSSFIHLLNNYSKVLVCIRVRLNNFLCEEAQWGLLFMRTCVLPASNKPWIYGGTMALMLDENFFGNNKWLNFLYFLIHSILYKYEINCNLINITTTVQSV